MNEKIQVAERIGELQYGLYHNQHLNQRGGYIHSWLVAGPIQTPVHDLDRYRGADFKAQIARAYYREPIVSRSFRPEGGIPLLGQRSQGDSSSLRQPQGGPQTRRNDRSLVQELAPAEKRQFESDGPTGDKQTLTWQVLRCGDDHYVNLSGFYHTCHYLSAWAYAKVVAPVAEAVELTLTTNGPADVWINGEHAHRQEHHALQRPQSHRFPATLQAGENALLIRFEVVAARACPFLMALHIDSPQAEQYHVRLPTTLEPLSRRERLEQTFDQAYLKRSVYHRQDELHIYWPENMNADAKRTDKLMVRLQSPTGRIYGEAHPDVRNGTRVNFGAVYQVPDGLYHVVLMPSAEEYYLQQMKVERHIPLHIYNGKYAETRVGTPHGTIVERRIETLRHAAQRDINLYSEIARMALGQWEKVRPDVVLHSIERINQRVDCSDFDMVGLLGALLRYGNDPNFPEALKAPLAECVLNFKYWMDEPGDDAMCYWTENHQILFHTCQVLAGQLFPDARFSNTGQSGTWHRTMGEQRALSWLRKRATGGFMEWDSNCYFCEDVLALAHLADLAEDNTVAEMAAVVLDKLCFTMALNSFKGVFGSTHGRSYTSLILSGHDERTSGISRLLWGQGALNDRITGSVGLACAESYELPPIIEAIAVDQPPQLWNRERHAGQRETWCDLDDDSWEINKVTYKTPDYMLCSAQDYRPGEQGIQQHIWQATLGPDAVAFVNHPVCVHDQNDLRPNFWSGNGVLPRVAQWKETLIGLYRLPADDWMGLTHAYFPIAAFDEFEMRDGWAFGRKDDGYIALTAANGLQLQERGPWAYREIRSPGLHNIWICQMGRKAEDGAFSNFIEANLAHAPHFDDLGDALAVRLETIRGESLAFAWEGNLLVNGSEEQISGFRHYDNPYCQAELPTEEMVIQYQDHQMRLDFGLDTQE